MLNKNRKGVSEVVANVLIVLLVIVGIAVIWSVVKPTIERTADTVQSDCFTVQVEPQSCDKVTCGEATTSATCILSGCSFAAGACSGAPDCTGASSAACTAVPGCSWSGTACSGTALTHRVVVKRNPGIGNFENIELIFDDRANSGRVAANPVVTQTALTELATKSIDSNLPTAVTGTTVYANIVLRANGQLCQITTSPIICS